MSSHFPYVEFQGSPFEVGLQHGRTLRKLIQRQRDDALELARRTAGLSRQAALDWSLAQLPAIRALSLAWEDELRGLAEGAAMEFAEAVALQVRPGTGAMPEGCTSIAVGVDRTIDGRPLAGQNRDLVPSYRERMFVGLWKIDGSPTLLMHGVPGELGGVGLNGHGVCVFANALWGTGGRTWMAPPILRRLVLECSTAEEAARRVLATSGAAAGNYLVADAVGEIRNLEILTKGVVVTALSRGAYVHTNHCLDAGLRPHEVQDRHPAPGTYSRLARSQALLEEAGLISVDTLKSIFSDQASRPEPICRTAAEGDSLETTATTIIEPSTRTLHISYGPPCEERWATHRIPA